MVLFTTGTLAMIGLALPNGADFAWFHIWWLVLVAAVVAVVKASWYRAPLRSVGCLSTVAWGMSAPKLAEWALAGRDEFVLFPVVVAGCALFSAILPWRRSPTLLDLLQRGAATAVICVMPIPVLLMVAGLIQAIIGPR
jgi:hypothetical protein